MEEEEEEEMEEKEEEEGGPCIGGRYRSIDHWE
jgi:hypothetical protein